MTTPETQVVASCLRLLRLRGAFAWRNNTGVARLIGRGGKPRPVRFGAVGSPDIIGVLRGVPLGVECKSANGTQSDAQREFEAGFVAAGGVYLLVRSAAELSEKLDAILQSG